MGVLLRTLNRGFASTASRELRYISLVHDAQSTSNLRIKLFCPRTHRANSPRRPTPANRGSDLSPFIAAGMPTEARMIFPTPTPRDRKSFPGCFRDGIGLNRCPRRVQANVLQWCDSHRSPSPGVRHKGCSQVHRNTPVMAFKTTQATLSELAHLHRRHLHHYGLLFIRQTTV